MHSEGGMKREMVTVFVEKWKRGCRPKGCTRKLGNWFSYCEVDNDSGAIFKNKTGVGPARISRLRERAKNIE